MRSWHDYTLISSIPNDGCRKVSLRKSFKNVSMLTFLELFFIMNTFETKFWHFFVRYNCKWYFKWYSI